MHEAKQVALCLIEAAKEDPRLASPEETGLAKTQGPKKNSFHQQKRLPEIQSLTIFASVEATVMCVPLGI